MENCGWSHKHTGQHCCCLHHTAFTELFSILTCQMSLFPIWLLFHCSESAILRELKPFHYFCDTFMDEVCWWVMMVMNGLIKRKKCGIVLQWCWEQKRYFVPGQTVQDVNRVFRVSPNDYTRWLRKNCGQTYDLFASDQLLVHCKPRWSLQAGRIYNNSVTNNKIHKSTT